MLQPRKNAEAIQPLYPTTKNTGFQTSKPKQLRGILIVVRVKL